MHQIFHGIFKIILAVYEMLYIALFIFFLLSFSFIYSFNINKKSKSLYCFNLSQLSRAMKKIPTQLTFNAISNLSKIENGFDTNAVVQLLQPKINHTKGTIQCNVSDGKYFIGGFIELSKFSSSTKFQNTIILVKNHYLFQSKGIVLDQFDIIGQYPEAIGSPTKFINDTLNPPENIHFPIKIQLLKKIGNLNQNQNPNEMVNQEIKQNIQQTEQQISPQSLMQIGTIKQLYANIDQWQIVARIIRKTYKQFTNKKNKQIKLLSITLIDKSKTKIDGVVFGNSALAFNQQLEEGRIYRISRGQVSQDQFNSRNKAENESQFKILFGEKSSFKKVKDMTCIPKADESCMTLSQVYNQKIFGQQFEVVAILLYIGQKNEIPPKDSKPPRKKRQLLVADPQTSMTLNVVVWGDNIEAKPQWVKKTVLLSGFRLNEWKETISLASGMKSFIQPLENHRFCKLQKQIHPESFEYMSEKKQKQVQNVITNLKDLRDVAMYMESQTLPVKSQLNLLVSSIHIDKTWFYEGCPDPTCKKSVKNQTHCPKCGTQIKNTLPHFIMGVDLADPSGTVRVTAYDDFAHRIILGQDFSQDRLPIHVETIRNLNQLSKDQKMVEMQKHLYQEFKVVLQTSMQNGQIKHKYTKVSEVNPIKSMNFNLSEIKNIMGYNTQSFNR